MHIALDFETTGLLDSSTDDPDKQPAIVEIGAVRSDGEEFSSLVKPDQFFQAKAQEITGISEEEVDQAPLFCTVIRRLSMFSIGCDTLLTFNGSGFDIPLLSYQLRRNKMETMFPWPPIQFDVMVIGRDIMNLPGRNGPKFPKLVEMYSWLFDEDFEAHRALADAKATNRCAMELAKRGFIAL